MTDKPEYPPLQGLAAYLRAEAHGVRGTAHTTLCQWADEVDRAMRAAQPVPVELHQPKCPALIGDEYLASGTSWNRRTQTTPPAVVELLTDAQKFSRNPYKHSRSAASIWLNGFAAAELWYRIGIKKGDSHGLPT